MDKVFPFFRAVRHTLDRIEIRMPTEGRSSFDGLLALAKGFVVRIASGKASYRNYFVSRGACAGLRSGARVAARNT